MAKKKQECQQPIPRVEVTGPTITTTPRSFSVDLGRPPPSSEVRESPVEEASSKTLSHVSEALAPQCSVIVSILNGDASMVTIH